MQTLREVSAALAVSVAAGLYAAFAGLYFASAPRGARRSAPPRPAMRWSLRVASCAVVVAALAGCIVLAGVESGVALWLALVCTVAMLGLLAAAVSRALFTWSAALSALMALAALAGYSGV